MVGKRFFLRLLAFALLLGLAGAAVCWAGGDERTRRSIAASLWLAVGANGIALPVGTAIAVVLFRTDVAGRRWGAVLLAALLLMPLYVQLSGWDALAGKNGWYTLAYGSVAEPLLQGMQAAIWVHGLAAAAWVALIVGVGLRLVDTELEEAALLDASPLKVLVRVTLPQAAPFVAAAALWVGISTTTEMTVTNIYLVSTYTEEFYLSLALSPSLTEATLQVLPGIVGLMLLTGACLAAIVWLLPRLEAASLRSAMRMPLGRFRWPATVSFWLLMLTLFGVPALSLGYKAGVEVRLDGAQAVHSWSGLKLAGVLGLVVDRFHEDFGWTAAIAGCSATAALLVAVTLAWFARGSLRWSVTGVVTAVCVALPGPLVAVIIITLLNQPSIAPLVWLYDETIAGPLAAQAVRALPLVLLIVWPALGSFRDEDLAAASLDGAGRFVTLLAIVLPARRGALGAAWLAAFAVSAGDLGHSLLVIPPGIETIQRRIFGLVHAGVEEQVAGVCLIVTGVYLLSAVCVVRLLTPAEERRRQHDVYTN